MHLVVVTPQGAKVDAQPSMVTVPGTVGELGILPGHRPLITSLAIGLLSYVENGKTHVLATNEGFLEVHDDRIAVVTETAENPDDIDGDRARASLEAAEAALKTIDPQSDPVTWQQTQDKRLRALNRIAALKYATPAALRQQAGAKNG
jgi:F-type H+-transporting ATPase subunit epsilon